MKLFWFLSLAVAAVIAEKEAFGYHAKVGIPLATSIRKTEDAIFSSGSRIIGGQPAPLGAHPYLVGIIVHIGNIHSACSSSMVSNTRIITAAHCWTDGLNTVESFTLVFGSEYLYYGGIRVNTDDVVAHEGWNINEIRVEYDVAVVRFPHVPYTEFIRPISLPPNALLSNDFVGVWAQASGFGMIGDGIPISPNQVQSHVTLQVIANSVCQVVYGPFVTEKILCTSGVRTEGPVGVCSSDSGGPLSIVYNGQRVLIGVVSFGAIPCEGGLPSGFVRVTEHMSWIQPLL